MLSRNDTVRLATYNPGLDTKPHSIDYRSKNTLEQLPLGYPASDDKQYIHHVVAVQEHLRPLLENLSEAGQIQILNRLIQKGVPAPNDPRNLLALNQQQHDAVHNYQKFVGLESNNELEKRQFLEKVSRLPLQERLIAADTFAEQMYPAIIENLHSMGYKVPTQAENIARYNQAVLEERQGENQNYIREVMKGLYGEKPTMENINRVMEAPMPDLAQAYKDGYVEGIQGVMASEEGAGDNRPKSMVFNNKGDVTISGPARINGNGKNKKRPH